MMDISSTKENLTTGSYRLPIIGSSFLFGLTKGRFAVVVEVRVVSIDDRMQLRIVLLFAEHSMPGAMQAAVTEIAVLRRVAQGDAIDVFTFVANEHHDSHDKLLFIGGRAYMGVFPPHAVYVAGLLLTEPDRCRRLQRCYHPGDWWPFVALAFVSLRSHAWRSVRRRHHPALEC